MVEPETAGSPMNAQKWVRSSLRHLSKELKAKGHPACPKTVGRLLKKMDYALKANRKRLAGSQHPDRNRQFEYIEAQKQLFLSHGWPVISIDAKKKELIGNFKNAGRCWCQEAEAVNDHDFNQDALGKAVPYGIYDLNHNRGYVYVGQSADTAEFAVAGIARWWQDFGQHDFPHAPCLLTLCDSGGSNGVRCRLWKWALQEKLADRFQLAVTVCHYPTGASKWNPVEHRLFSEISKHCAGQPLFDYPTIVRLMRETKTQTGLRVHCALSTKHYATKIKVSDEQMTNLDLLRHPILPAWNYTLLPRINRN